MTEIVYRIIDNKTGKEQGVYWRGNYDKYDFGSVEEARSSNCHDIYQNKDRYSITSVEITERVLRTGL